MLLDGIIIEGENKWKTVIENALGEYQMVMKVTLNEFKAIVEFHIKNELDYENDFSIR
jgi:hypothetical protein